MRTAVCALGFSIPFVAACALPERDNPFDPASGRTPVAVLTYEVEEADGTVHAGPEGSRSSLFRFDATASSGAAGADLAFAWQTSRTDCSTAETFVASSSETGPVFTVSLTLDSAMLPVASGGVGAAVWNVCVRVSDGPGGPSAIAQTQAVVRNQRPVAFTGEDWFVAPVAAPVEVVLDACGQVPIGTCEVADPDGDELVYDWTQVAGTPVSFTPEDPSGRKIRFTPVASRSGFRFEVSASDGLATVTKDVTVWSESVLWYATESPGRLFRVHPDARGLKRFRNSGGALTPWSSIGFLKGAAVDPLTGDRWISGASGTIQLDASYTELASYSAYGRSIAMVGPNACLGGTGGDGTEDGIWILRPPSTTILAVPAAALSSDALHNVVAADGAGRCWTLTDVSGTDYELGRLDPATGAYEIVAQGLPHPTGSGEAFEHLVATVDGGAWLALSYGNPPCEGLCRVSPDGNLQTVLDAQIDGLAVAPDGMTPLVHFYDDGPWYQVDATGGQTPIDEIPAMLRPGPSTTDFSSQTVWFTDETGLLVGCRRTSAGWLPCRSLLADDVDGDNGMSWVDVSPDPISGAAIGLIRSAGATPDTVAVVPAHVQARRAFVPLPVGASGTDVKLSSDPATGQVWHSDRYIVGNVGTKKYTAGGAVTFDIPFIGSGQRPEEVTALPAGGSWAFVRDLTDIEPPRLVRLDRDANVVESVDLGDRTQMTGMAAGPDGTLCFGTTSESGKQELSRIDAAGVMQSLGTGHFETGDPTRPVVSADGGCWFSGSNPGDRLLRILHYAPTASTPDVNRLENVANRFGYLARITADPRDGSVWVAHSTATGSGSDFLLERIASNGAVVESYASVAGWTRSIFEIVIRPRCTDPADPRCLDVWQLTAGPEALLLRSDGRVDEPVESIPLGGSPAAVSLAP